MGLSSNQARFLSLTARQVDMEQRIQQICQRRLRLSSELENVATAYNNSISNRKMFTHSTMSQGIQALSILNLDKVGYKVMDNKTKTLISSVNSSAKQIKTEQDFLNLLSVINTGGAFSAAALADNYVLNCDINFADNVPFNNSVVNGTFTGVFDGNGHTISGATINATGSVPAVSMFKRNNGTIKNLALDDFTIISTGASITNNAIGIAAGWNGGTMENITVTNSNITANGDNYKMVGGFVGQNAGVIKNSSSEVDIIVGDNAFGVGGFAGDTYTGSNIDSCYSSGSIVTGNNADNVGGFAKDVEANTPVSNSYTTVDVTVGANSHSIAGFAGSIKSGGSITNSYCSNTVNVGVGSFDTGGMVGFFVPGSTVGSDNFYQNDFLSDGTGSSAINGNILPLPTGGWSNDVWDKSTTLPTLRNVSSNSADTIEEKLRSGEYSLVRQADEFTQDPLTINGDKYQEIDWRSTPELFDELYKGDDVDAENKYDKTIEEINSQDKKLQLEQTSVEVEYKAVSSEKEAVKKILDTNVQSSFKYFS